MKIKGNAVNIEEMRKQLNLLSLSALGEDDIDEESDCLIIGLDFGTTYSGIAYAFSALPEKIYTIQDWDGVPGRKPLKVPTVMKYENKNVFQWGYECGQTTPGRIEGLKLLLDPKQPKPLYLPRMNTKTELGKPAIDVAADYIGAIYLHALKKIEGKNPKGYLNTLQKKFVLTVPAVWTDKAKDATLQAARRAGIHPVKLIKEPEAAALFTIHSMKRKGLAVGDAFVLCDAGGGTVDLISYEITKMSPLELKELVPSKGGLAGSIVLNKRFEEYVGSLVGDEKFFQLKKTNGYGSAMKQFDESVKTAYFADDDQEHYINFPLANLQDDPGNKIQANCLTLTSDVLGDIFHPVVTEVERLVEEQVNLARLKKSETHQSTAEIKAIFLVGGFGSSPHLKQCIEKSPICRGIQVIQPEDAWAAIVRGAVLSELPQEAAVVSSIAQRHYGVKAGVIYDESEHDHESRYWDSYENVWRVSKMTWYIKKGESLERERKINFPFYRTFPSANLSPDDRVISETLLECDNIFAPRYPSNTVKTNCTITADLGKVPKRAFKKKKTLDGSAYCELHYTMAVTITSASMLFSVEIDGKNYGQGNAEYH